MAQHVYAQAHTLSPARSNANPKHDLQHPHPNKISKQSESEKPKLSIYIFFFALPGRYIFAMQSASPHRKISSIRRMRESVYVIVSGSIIGEDRRLKKKNNINKN